MKNSELKTALTQLKRSINKKRSLAIIENVLIKDNYLTTTDLETFQMIPTNSDKTGLVNFEFLQKISQKLSASENISFDFSDQKAFIQVNNENLFSIGCDNIEDYPINEETFEKTDFCYSGEFYQSFIKFCSKDELRMSMTGLYISDTHFCATDAHKLKFIKHNKEVKKDIIIPSFVLAMMSKKENYTLYLNEEIKNNKEQYHQFVSDTGHKIIFREIDAKYPDFKAVIRDTEPIKATVNKTDLVKNLKLAGIAANSETNQVIIEFCKGMAMITSQDLDLGTNFENAIQTSLQGECIKIGFNCLFLLDILDSIDSDVISFNLDTPNRAAIINEEFLIMPVMIQD